MNALSSDCELEIDAELLAEFKRLGSAIWMGLDESERPLATPSDAEDGSGSQLGNSRFDDMSSTVDPDAKSLT